MVKGLAERLVGFRVNALSNVTPWGPRLWPYLHPVPIFGFGVIVLMGARSVWDVFLILHHILTSIFRILSWFPAPRFASIPQSSLAFRIQT